MRKFCIVLITWLTQVVSFTFIIEKHGHTQENIDAGVAAIADRLNSVLTEAQSRKISPAQVALERAEDLIRGAQNDLIPTVAA